MFEGCVVSASSYSSSYSKPFLCLHSSVLPAPSSSRSSDNWGRGTGIDCSGGEEGPDLAPGDLGIEASSVTTWILFKSQLPQGLTVPICQMGGRSIPNASLVVGTVLGLLLL